jgi:hypothetical protein
VVVPARRAEAADLERALAQAHFARHVASAYASAPAPRTVPRTSTARSRGCSSGSVTAPSTSARPVSPTSNQPCSALWAAARSTSRSTTSLRSTSPAIPPRSPAVPPHIASRASHASAPSPMRARSTFAPCASSPPPNTRLSTSKTPRRRAKLASTAPSRDLAGPRRAHRARLELRALAVGTGAQRDAVRDERQAAVRDRAHARIVDGERRQVRGPFEGLARAGGGVRERSEVDDRVEARRS